MHEQVLEAVFGLLAVAMFSFGLSYEIDWRINGRRSQTLTRTEILSRAWRFSLTSTLMIAVLFIIRAVK